MKPFDLKWSRCTKRGGKTAFTMILILLCAAWSIPRMDGLEYHFINQNLTWYDAQQFCRENYQDLATVTSLEAANALQRLENYSGLAWIGLLIDTEDFTSAWRWTATGNALGSFQNWVAGVPSGSVPCTSSDSSARWSEHYCSHGHAFLCYEDVNGAKVYHFITLGRTWAEARDYCRTNYKDLAMIETSAENDQVAAIVTDYYCWIGLYYEQREMTWSDGTISAFTNWGTNPTIQQCAAEDLTHVWTSKACDQTLPFFCHGVEKRKNKVFQIKFLSDLDMTNADNYKKMLQQLEVQMKKMGLIRINISLKSSPRKQISGTKSLSKGCNP